MPVVPEPATPAPLVCRPSSAKGTCSGKGSRIVLLRYRPEKNVLAAPGMVCGWPGHGRVHEPGMAHVRVQRHPALRCRVAPDTRAWACLRRDRTRKAAAKSRSCRRPPWIIDRRYSLFVINSQRRLASSIGWKPSTFCRIRPGDVEVEGDERTSLFVQQPLKFAVERFAASRNRVLRQPRRVWRRIRQPSSCFRSMTNRCATRGSGSLRLTFATTRSGRPFQPDRHRSSSRRPAPRRY